MEEPKTGMSRGTHPGKGRKDAAPDESALPDLSEELSLATGTFCGTAWEYAGEIRVWKGKRTGKRASAAGRLSSMHTQRKEEVDSVPAYPELSLIRGGPFYRAQEAVRLIQPQQWNLGRRITFAIAVGWAPLLVITALFNPGAMLSLLKDYRVHSRMLIAVPVLVIGQMLMEERFGMVVAHLLKADLLRGPDVARLDEIIGGLRRLRDSVIPELLIVVALVVHTLSSMKALVDATPWLAHGAWPNMHLTPAGWYGVLVSVTIFQFLLGLSLWKWLLWTIFALRLSRLNLRLIATHADGHGGLGFLGLTPVAFAPVAFAVTAVIGATWRHEILNAGAKLMSFKLPAIALVVIIAGLALGPLAIFLPKLAKLRREGMLEYGILGQMLGAEFEEKWIAHRAGHEAELLAAPEISTLADYGQCYERVDALKPFPADQGALIMLGAAVVVPLLPTILAVIPLVVILKTLLKAIG